jgi:hypothetical protein
MLREQQAFKAHQQGNYDYVDTWGLHHSFDYVFAQLSQAPSILLPELRYRLN